MPEPFESNNQSEPKKKSGLFIALASLAAVVIILFILGIVPRILDMMELKQAHQETVDAVPVVHTVIAKPASSTESLVLPGNIGAILYTTIYARIDGYLKSRFVDIGDVVKKGQLLAVIESPTVDEAVNQAKADLDKAKADLLSAEASLKQAIAEDITKQADVEKSKANVNYATVTVKRWQDLCFRGAVSQQSRDEKVRFYEAQTAELKAAISNEKAAQAKVATAQANVVAAKANVKAKAADLARVAADQNFEKVVAPFDGIITLRKVDPGALITKGSSTSTLELFQIADIRRMRIYIGVPQRVARYLQDGMTADILMPEYPERVFKAVVTNISGALDPNTRTRQTEVQIDNVDHSLLPGMYSEVRFNALREAPWIRVPGTTIITRADGQYLVVVDSNNKVHYQKILLGRDYGDEIEIRVGLKGGEQVVISPSDDLQEGETVQPIALATSTTPR
jgi:RND family efflux transporter MFP subunit